MRDDEMKAARLEDERRHRRQIKIAVLVYAIIEAIILTVLVYKILQTR